jgi:hypothetical protein
VEKAPVWPELTTLLALPLLHAPVSTAEVERRLGFIKSQPVLNYNAGNFKTFVTSHWNARELTKLQHPEVGAGSRVRNAKAK